MNQISRIGMFETNSSSTHSVVINGAREIEKSFMDTLQGHNGKVILEGGSYQWGYALLYGAMEKLNYLATCVFTDDGGQSQNESILRQAVRKQSGLDIVWVPDNSDNGWYNQSIDHQSVGNVPIKDVDEVINIIFNPNIVIEISHDNGGRRIVEEDKAFDYYFEWDRPYNLALEMDEEDEDNDSGY